MDTPVKRFVLFVCEHYYPGGGWNDYKGSFDTLEAALEEGARHRGAYRDVDVVDLLTGREVR